MSHFLQASYFTITFSSTYTSSTYFVLPGYFLCHFLLSYLPLPSPPLTSLRPQGWVPWCPPGAMDSHCSHIRDGISVLFFFERQRVFDQDFSADCRTWLSQLVRGILPLQPHYVVLFYLIACMHACHMYRHFVGSCACMHVDCTFLLHVHVCFLYLHSHVCYLPIILSHHMCSNLSCNVVKLQGSGDSVMTLLLSTTDCSC